MTKLKKIDPEQITSLVGTIGYDILDNVISTMCGIDGVIADLYLVDIGVYADGDKQTLKIAKKILKRYKIKDEHGLYSDLMSGNWPIALIVLLILEDGDYSFLLKK